MNDRFVASLTSRKFVIALLAVTILFGGVGLAADAGEVTATLSPDEAEANAGEKITFDVVVEGVEDDIGAHTTTIKVTDTDVAEIVDLEPAGDPLFEPDDPVSEDGSTATVDVVYGDEAIDSDADNEVIIATVTIETKEIGTVSIEQTIEALGDGDGQSITVTDSEDAELEVDTEPADPAEPALSGLNIAGDGIEAAITEGDNESIDMDVENVGDEADRFRIDLSIDDEVTVTEGIDVGPGETRTLTFDGVTDGLDVQDEAYTVTVQDNEEVADALIGDLTVEVEPEQAEPALSNLEIAGDGDDATITERDDESISVDVENVGDEEGTFGIELDINGVDTSEEITLDADTTEEVEFTGVTDGLDARDDVYTVTVQDSDGDAEISGNLMVEQVDDEDPDVGIRHAESAAAATNTLVDGQLLGAEHLVVESSVDDQLTIGGDTDRTIEIRHPETDRSLEVTTEGDEAVTGDGFRLFISDGDGTLSDQPTIASLEGDSVDVELEGDENIFTDIDGPFTTYTMALQEDGEEIDTTDKRLIGIGYEGAFEQTGTEDEVEITLPRDDEVDESWDIEFRLGATEDDGPLATTAVDNQDGDDLFETTVDVSDVEQGVYGAHLRMAQDTADPDASDRVLSVFEFESITVGDPEDIAPEIGLEADAGGSTDSPIPIDVSIEQREPETASLEIVDSEDNVVFSESVEEDFQDSQTVSRRLVWDATDQGGDPVDDGEYTAVFTVEDEFGNEVVTEETIVVDNTPPEIDDLELVSDPVTNEDDDIVIRADISSDPSDLEAVQMGVLAEFTSYSNTIAFEGEELENELDGDTLEVTIDPSDVADDVGDGEFTVVADAINEAGVQATEEADSVTIDTSAPEIQPRVTDLGEDDATLEIEADEDVTIEEIDIEAAAGENTEDRFTDELPSELTDEFEIDFDGTTVNEEDTTFTIDVDAEDEAGNEDTYQLTSSITGYELEDGEATVDPDATDGAFDLSADEDAEGERSAAVGQTSSAPAGTSVDANQIAEEFIDVADIGLDEDELEDATVRVPLEDIDVEGFDDEDLVFFYSPEGEEDYEVLEPESVDDELVVDVDGFSQLAPGGVDDQPPSLDDTTIDPGTELDADDGDVTLTFEYSPVISDIDVSETRVDVDLDGDRTDVQITSHDTEVVVEDLQSDESFTVELTLVDEAGNDVTTTETLSMGDASEDESEDDEEASSGGGGSGGGGAGAPVPDDAQFEISAPEVSGQEDGTTPIDVMATITNAGGPSEGQSIGLEIDGETVAEKELALGSNGQATVEFSGVDISELSDGEYTYRITTGDDTYMDTLTISTAESPDDTDREVETADDASDEPTDAPTDTPEEESEDETPGFGAVVALIALIAAALLASRQYLLD